MRSLGLVQRGDQRIEIGRLDVIRTKLLDVILHSFLAASHSQQLAVERHIPVPVQTEFLKRGVECRPVTVTLGISQGSIDIEQQCFDHLCPRMKRLFNCLAAGRIVILPCMRNL